MANETVMVTVAKGGDRLTTLVRFAEKAAVPAIQGMPREGKIPVAKVRASASDDNVAAGAVDGDLATRWSAEGDGQTLICEFAAAEPIARVAAVFFKGAERSTSFELAVSPDGASWETVFRGRSSGASAGAEIFTLAKPVTARQVRFTGKGNSQNGWNSVVELAFLRP